MNAHARVSFRVAQARRSAYEILNEIGAGASSIVYKVQCKELIWRCDVSLNHDTLRVCIHHGLVQAHGSLALKDSATWVGTASLVLYNIL